jgi:hypothetical protein
MPKGKKVATVKKLKAKAAPAVTVDDALRTLERLAERLPVEVAGRLAAHLAGLVSMTKPTVRFLPGSPDSVTVDGNEWANDSPLGVLANLLSIYMSYQSPASDIRIALTMALAQFRPPRGPKKRGQAEKMQDLQRQGKTQRQIAEELHIERESVRQALRRSRKRQAPILVEVTPPANSPRNRADG